MTTTALVSAPPPAAPAPTPGRRYRGLVAALVVSAAAIAFQYHHHRDEVSRFTRFELPAFDPYVYVAMAEHPRFFTVAPWGYRILTPWVVRALPVRSVVRGFRIVTFSGLVGAGTLLYVFFRRLGHGPGPSLVAVAVFGLSAPVGECVEGLFVAEPLSLTLLLAFLLAVEWQAGLGILTLLVVLLSYSKEVWPLLLPLVFVAERRHGWRRALFGTVLAALAALLASQSVRLFWVPHIRPPHAPLTLDSARAAWDGFWASGRETWSALALWGITPLAVLGAALPRGRAVTRRYGYLALALIALALLAWVYIPAPVAVPLYGANTLRLMVYALPLLLALALFVPDAVRRHWRPPAPAAPVPSWASRSAAVLAVLALAFPFLVLDRYRRVPLHQYRDGPLVLTLCRESLRTARRLQAGRETAWWLVGPPEAAASSDELPDLKHLRWFLREGWGPEPHHGTREAVMHSAEAALLLPLLEPRDLDLRLGLLASAPLPVRVAVNGRELAQWLAGPAGEPRQVRIPAALLFRGDNRVTLATTASGVVRLQALAYRPAP